LTATANTSDLTSSIAEPRDFVCEDTSTAEDRDDGTSVCGDWRTQKQRDQTSKVLQTARMGDVASGLRMGITASTKDLPYIGGRKCDGRRTNSQVRKRQARETEEGQEGSYPGLSTVF
jgi:hypothetical protein